MVTLLSASQEVKAIHSNQSECLKIKNTGAGLNGTETYNQNLMESGRGSIP